MDHLFQWIKEEFSFLKTVWALVLVVLAFLFEPEIVRRRIEAITSALPSTWAMAIHFLFFLGVAILVVHYASVLMGGNRSTVRARKKEENAMLKTLLHLSNHEREVIQMYQGNNYQALVLNAAHPAVASLLTKKIISYSGSDYKGVSYGLTYLAYEALLKMSAGNAQ